MGAAAIDVSPIVVRSIVFDTGEYIPAPPLRFDVSFDAEAGLFDLEGDFGVILCAETRDALEDLLADTLGLQWDEYALQGPDALSPKAQGAADWSSCSDTSPPPAVARIESQQTSLRDLTIVTQASAGITWSRPCRPGGRGRRS